MIDLTPSLVLVVLAGVLVASGVYLLLERSLTRIAVGLALLANGINVAMLIASGRAGYPALVGDYPTESMSDALPQAMVLTAIVITLGTTAFILALAYRSWQLNGHDEVQDDLEDRRLARRAARDEIDARVTDDSGLTVEEEAASTRDETSTEEEDVEEWGTPREPRAAKDAPKDGPRAAVAQRATRAAHAAHVDDPVATERARRLQADNAPALAEPDEDAPGGER